MRVSEDTNLFAIVSTTSRKLLNLYHKNQDVDKTMTTKMCRSIHKEQDSHFNTAILLSHSLQRWIQREAPASTEQPRYCSQCTRYLQRYLRSLLLVLQVHLHVRSSASSKEGRLYSLHKETSISAEKSFCSFTTLYRKCWHR